MLTKTDAWKVENLYNEEIITERVSQHIFLEPPELYFLVQHLQRLGTLFEPARLLLESEEYQLFEMKQPLFFQLIMKWVTVYN